METLTLNLEISNEKLNLLESEISKLTKFAIKLNLPSPIVEKTGTKDYYILTEYDNKILDTFTDDEIKIIKFYRETKKHQPNIEIAKITVNLFNLTIFNNLKPIDEYELIGVIDHTTLMVKNAPNKNIPFEHIPEKLNDCSCDHCKTNRKRNETIIVKNVLTNEYHRVGGSCVQYYLGVNYKHIIEYLNDILNLNNFIFDYTSSECRYLNLGKSISFNEIITYFVHYTEHNSFVSISTAKVHDTISTKQTVFNYLYYIYTSNEHKMSLEEYREYSIELQKFNSIIEKSDYSEFITKFKEYVESEYKNNNFLFNVHNMIITDTVYIKTLSYFLSALSFFYSKYIKIKFETPINSEYIGNIGEKIKFENLTINSILSFNTIYGENTIYNMSDNNGNVIIKFGTINTKFNINKSEDEIKIGSIVSFISDIKEHKTYNNIKQTVIGRLSVLK